MPSFHHAKLAVKSGLDLWDWTAVWKGILEKWRKCGGNDYGDCDSCKNPCLMKDLQDYLSLKVFIIFFNNFTSYSTGYCLLNWGRVLPFTKLVSATQNGLVFSPYAFKLSMDFNCLDLT